ncbi:cyclic nucleotide-gated ion channel 1-like isoform X1 [Rosa rugosa]|uniref:cyclic nucleotide-gated ion channel 1-like isoform X1 n=1 Tax=Rosa rugosa TaxID=74645 RepID=UPI002B400E02|nr:cyclic nucleotide-gated ion channel 1-like isoform X1 [Rosa rugosa]XP_062003277.1 cyclic nucleotide-gated ion channel 1-like isoform X1 [Rosa rugosa]XP_062003278.1 cyclic nucleotide-gated ion channel 1-like isoform X1 [Rosa rugosa]XP_062025103.1 cyclic nucleotide-gated ion channel 1-like isoform X1 [Rosa rugosa]XP_062025104.1 cyclic nucleotide-gated ion channel 1-like isoform X1 [Rosa rugosa]
MSNKQVPNDVPMMSNTRGIKYNFDNVEAQPPDPPCGDRDAVSTKEKFKGTLLSISFWNKMFVIACVIAVSLDPLFFYIPIIDEEEKCLAEDKELRTIALILRSLTDVTFVVNIIYHVCEAINAAYRKREEKKPELASDWEFAKLVVGKLAWRSTLTSILAVFPMPQLLLVFVFFKMRGRGYLQGRKILNVFLLAQYLPRIYRIYLSSQKLRQTTGIWAKALFNFFLYILASHVLGAFWYFFSIQRETSCWHWACVDHSTNVEGCMSTLYCEVHNTTPRNATFLNQFCLISAEENAKGPSDFGIFLDSLKNGITGNIPFGKKLSYSFWWGLRNLSNFGTNLETSTYVWENCFAVFISIIGLLLFLYLLGNVQTFMSMEIHRWETQRWENQRREDERNKIQLKEKYSGWMDRNEIPDDLKKKIMKNIEQKLEENKDTDPKNLFSILPTHTRTCLKRFLGLKLLKKVPKLARMDKRVLKMMCDYLKPVMHDEGDEVFQMGAPLHRMLLITEGTLLTDRNAATENAKTGSISSSPSVGNLGKGDFYGAEELIEWVTQKKDLGQLPASSFNVKCNSKVEGFVLKAKQLRSVVSKNENRWKMALASQTTA